MIRNKILSFSLVLFASLALLACADDKTAPSSAIPAQTVSITISPETASLSPGGEASFTASVSGTSNTAVKWSIPEGVAGGTISSTNGGNYSAPFFPGTYHLVATSQADPSKTATATITVMAHASLNTNFGSGGTSSTAFGGIDTIKAVVIQSDGKIVVGGASLDGTKSNFALARYEPSGILDESFGANGFVTTSFGNGFAGINALDIQADGKIVAGGNTNEFENSAFAVARYLSDGTLDTTFGPSLNGKVTALPGTQDNRLNALKMQGDKILVGGVSVVSPSGFISGNKDAFTLMRFQADGRVDISFGTDGNGIVKTLIQNQSGTPGSAEIMALAIQDDDKIVAGGQFSQAQQYFALARYNSDGILDSSFTNSNNVLPNVIVNPEGIVATRIGGGSEQVNALLIQDTDNKIVAGGFVFNGFAMVRYNLDGTLDTNVDSDPGTHFSTDGIVTTGGFASGGAARIHSLAFDTANNRIIAGGISFDGTNNSRFTLAGYDLEGELDPAFGPSGDGRVVTVISAGPDGIQAMQLESGKIIAAGFASAGPRIDFALARYDINGILETGAGTEGFDHPTGIVTTTIGGGSDEINALDVYQSDGKIIAAGFSFGVNNIKNKDFSLARYLSDGTLDTTFGVSGRVTTSIRNTTHSTINALDIQDADDKIVVGGSGCQGTGAACEDFVLARYLSDGSLDTSFGSDGDGTETRTNTGANEVINALSILSSEEILVAGTAFTDTNNNFILGRYTANGILDPTFGTGDPDDIDSINGIVTTRIGTGSSFAEAMAVQDDGKIILAGTAEVVVEGSTETSFDFALVRYNAAGGLDSGFDADGRVITPVSAGHDFAHAIRIQSDGKILVAGTSASSTGLEQFALVRYNTNGALDTEFGDNGIVITPLVGSEPTPKGAQPFALAIQDSDGKIVVGGYSLGTTTGRDFTLVRYLSDGRPDPSFGVNGIEISPFSAGMDEIRALRILSDGTILAGGMMANGNSENTDFHLAGYTP